MKQTVRKYISQLNRRDFTNNVQRVLHTLLTSSDSEGWVPRGSLRVPSATARVRDLRKDDFGGFDVVCKSASELGRRGGSRSFYYRVNRGSITLGKLRQVFGV